MMVNPHYFQTDAAVTIGTDLTTIVSVAPGGRQLANIEVENAGATAFSDLAVQVQDHPHGAWYTLRSGADWATVDQVNLQDATGANTLAGGSKAHLQLFVNAAYAFRIQAKVASGSTTARARGQAV